MSYSVVIQPAPEGGFWAFAPNLPGCLSQGETLEETMSNVKDAIVGYLAVLAEDGETIPDESGEPIFTRVTLP
jgi:predicted RNase H-like HicB family nuclease